MLAQQYLTTVQDVIGHLDANLILRAVEAIKEARNRSKYLYTIGNGGSASTASHFAADLSKSCGCKAFCLSEALAQVTAWSNDFNYENLFANELKHLVVAGDLVVAISGSGNSPNVLDGVRTAKVRGAATIALTALGGGRLKDLADISIVVPTSDMEIAEDVHLIICHIVKKHLWLGLK